MARPRGPGTLVSLARSRPSPGSLEQISPTPRAVAPTRGGDDSPHSGVTWFPDVPPSQTSLLLIASHALALCGPAQLPAVVSWEVA